MIAINQNTIQMLFALVRSAIRGNQLSEQERAIYSDEMLLDLMTISKKHDISHLVAEGLNKNGLLTKEKSEVGNEIIKAIYRHAQISYEYVAVCDALEVAQIPFIPLKGSVLRNWYPEPWMRTSCDIDILVHEDEPERAAEYLVDNCGYSREGKGSHDISLFSPSKNHIELHYDLVEAGIANASSEVLKQVWETAITYKDKNYWLEMPDDIFYFYHIAHMAKHFENGGCGIRPFIDIWILDGIDGAYLHKRNELLMQGNLLKFAEVARRLSKVWLDDAEHDTLTRQMEQYILRGGVYGTFENRIAVQQQKKGGRLKYALSKIFIPYDVIKFHYPILQKHRWLTPIMEVRRWFKLAFCGHARRVTKELKQNNNISHTEAENMRIFLRNVGL